ncbi:MAG: M1 family metallopeptidase [Clostridia bacterium]|nr:M1 family metallopeptidase [Clostridia bacterium]
MKKSVNIILIIFIVLVLAAFTAGIVFLVQRAGNETAAEEETEDIIPEIDETQEASFQEEVPEIADDIRDYQYDLELKLDVNTMTMDGVLDFTYYNNNSIPMDELVFYLYANSFEKEEYHAVEEEYFYLGYPEGFSPGRIDIESVDIKGGGSYEITGSQNHLLKLKLDEPVEPDDRTQINMHYTVTIPRCEGRFGYGEQTISIANCNPIMAVYDEETGYYEYEYNNIGDPFFSECADYTAKITIQKEYIVAPTGTIMGKMYDGDWATYSIDAENRRDFAFVASDDFKVATDKVNGVTVNSYSFAMDSVNERALEAGINSIEAFSSAFGQYPYDTFNVVQTNFYIGGMEYPGMVMIGSSFYAPFYTDIMEMIIAHEAAHQWWYAQVGNDQIAEPWLDESLATFSERVYYEHVYPDEYKSKIMRYVDSSFIEDNNDMELMETRIDLNTLEYGEEYSLVVYGFGGWMMDDLRDKLGDDMFFEAIKTYRENNLFQLATRQSLEEAIEEVTGEDITPWFDENLKIQVGN